MNFHAPLSVAIILALTLAAAPATPQGPIKPRSAHPVQPLLIVRGAPTPVQLAALAVTTEVEGGLARTTVAMRFDNPNDRRLEGELQFPLEPGQQISGFALDVDGHMRAAVPVPKSKGQEVFEAVERRGVDPGLLEQTAGNQFKLRIYPIPAHGQRQVRITIDQALRRDGRDWVLRLPLGFARGLDRVPLRVIARGTTTAPRVVDGFVRTPLTRQVAGEWSAFVDGRTVSAQPLQLAFAAQSQAQAFVQDFQGQRYFHAEVPVGGAVAPRAIPQVVGLLWDSSASARKRDIAAELALLDRYFAAMRNGQVRLTRLRDVAEPAQVFTIRNGDWSALRHALQTTVYDGASALEDWTPQADVGEYLLVSDGLTNYGLAAAMPKLAASQRLYAIDSAGADADTRRLSAWADARGGRLIELDGMRGVAAAAVQLTSEGPRLVGISGSGVDDLVDASRYPQQGMLRIAGRLRQPAGSIVLTLSEGGRERRVTLAVGAGTPASGMVADLWASYTMRALEAEPVPHAEAIAELGARFGLVGPNTSLIVLENAADYVRYDIPAPVELGKQVAQLQAAALAQRVADAKRQLAKVRREFAEKQAWWEKPWPKGAPLQIAREKARDAQAGSRGLIAADAAMPRPSPMPMPMPTARMMAPPPALMAAPAKSVAAGGNDAGDEGKSANIAIAMQAWNPDSPFARRLRAAPAAQAYAVYLAERDAHADSAAFYLDAAAVLFERGQRALALRVLSNLAEMNLENRQLLRVLGYRLMEAHEYPLAVRVFEHVRRLADNEPQSWRDLGLADAAAGRTQDAIDNLWKVVAGSWDSRFPSVELIALGELDAIAATSGKSLDLHAIPTDLRRNLPLDLRAVLSWDSDNTDIDLWVTDPNGEKTFYGSPHSYQGGWLSHDCTQGYGPEEFILRNAKPGKYVVQANFYGDHSQLITGPTSLSLHLFTGFGTARQKDQTVTLRLKDAKDTILVGTFDVK